MKRKKRLTEAERAEAEAFRKQVRANARRTRELAERAQAKLDPTYRPHRGPWRERVAENVRRTRELAERAQAKLDAERTRRPGADVS